MAREVMITTIDNPYDPFIQFAEWYAFDEGIGYHTCSYLARIAKTSTMLSPADYSLEVERAIDEIVKFNLNGKYRKVVRET